MPRLRKTVLGPLVLLLPLCGCAQMSDMFGEDGPFSFLHQEKKLPAMDAEGNHLSRGIVVAVRNVKADALPERDIPAGASNGKDPSKDKDQKPRKAIEYRILQDDGTTLVVVTEGDETDAITPGQRVLVVHGTTPRVMLETPLSDRQGV